MVIQQYQVFLVNLDPTVGREIKKSRPCVVISPNEMNANIGTVIIVPMTTKSHSYPTRVSLQFAGKQGWIVMDQVRTVDKLRLVKKLGQLENRTISEVKSILKEMLVD